MLGVERWTFSFRLTSRHSPHVIFRRAAMCLNKRRWIQPAACVFTITRPDERRDEFAHFKMQMGEITAAAGSHRCDLLAAPNIFARVHQHRFHMSVIGLRIFAFAIFDIRMQDNDDVTPARAAVARHQHAPIGNSINRIAQIAVFAADAIQIIAEMMIFSERLRVISHCSIFAAERKIKTRSGWK